VGPPNGGGHYPQRPSRGIEDDNDGKPVIKIKAGDLPCLVDATEDAVLGADRGLYKRGGQIVRVGDIELLGADEKKTTALAILDQSEHALLEDASASAHFLRFHKRENKWLPADPPMNVIRAWQARASRLRLPLLSGVISSPLILPTGRTIDKHGYDRRTGFFFDPLGTSFFRRCLRSRPKTTHGRRLKFSTASLRNFRLSMRRQNRLRSAAF
jgi:hypothetical protein